MVKAPYTQFGKRRNVEVQVYVDGKEVDAQEWDEEAWLERGEDWYAFLSPQWKGRRIRVVTPTLWKRAEEMPRQIYCTIHGLRATACCNQAGEL